MAVCVHNCFALETRKLEVRFVTPHEFGKQKNLCAEALRLFVRREQVSELIAEHRRTRGLENDDGRAGVYVLLDHVHHVPEITFSAFEHAPLVKWTAAAHWGFRNLYGETCVLQHECRSLRGFRMKVIVERVRPQDDFLATAP